MLLASPLGSHKKRASRGKHISMSNAPCSQNRSKPAALPSPIPVPPQPHCQGICAGKSGDGMREIAFINPGSKTLPNAIPPPMTAVPQIISKAKGESELRYLHRSKERGKQATFHTKTSRHRGGQREISAKANNGRVVNKPVCAVVASKRNESYPVTVLRR